MTTEYTPTLEEVRENYGWNGHDSYIESNREASKANFDRFLAKYRVEAQAEALLSMADELESRLAGYITETGQTRAGRDIIREMRDRAEQLKEATK